MKVDLMEAIRELNGLMDRPASKIEGPQLAMAMFHIGIALQDDDMEIPAEIFAEMTQPLRKMALAGLGLVLGHSLK